MGRGDGRGGEGLVRRASITCSISPPREKNLAEVPRGLRVSSKTPSLRTIWQLFQDKFQVQEVSN